MPRTWSPSTTRPVASTAISRSASPSSANPASAPRRHDRLGERGRGGRPGLDVDVHAIGIGVDDLDPGAGRCEDRAADRRARAVGGIEHEAQAAGVDRRREREPVRPVVVEPGAGVDHPAELGVRRTGQLLRPPDQLLELVLDRVVELEPVTVEHLETVVGRPGCARPRP